MSEQQKTKYQHTKGKAHFTLKGWPFGCLFLLLSCINHHITNNTEIDSAKTLIRHGDIIVRNGRDEISAAARSFNRTDFTYSHCGLCFIENDSVFVYHAIGGKENPSMQLKREYLNYFCASKYNDKFAIFRFSLSETELDTLKRIVKNSFDSKLMFDIFYNMTTDDKMYCSEFVYKSLSQAMNETWTIQPNKSIMLSYVTIDDLYLNKYATNIVKISYK